MKNIDNKLSTKLTKNPKEPILKGKLTKGFVNKEIESSNGNKSNETFANTDDDKQEFEYLNSESKENQNVESNIQQSIPNASIDITASYPKPKMRSRLSLKSSVYVRSKVPNLKDEQVTPTAVSISTYLILLEFR